MSAREKQEIEREWWELVRGNRVAATAQPIQLAQTRFHRVIFGIYRLYKNSSEIEIGVRDTTHFNCTYTTATTKRRQKKRNK